MAFALEGPLFLSIKLLIINPGKLFREYIGGKRKTYYKPVAFFILVTAVYLILKAWIGYDPLEGEFVKNGQDDLSLISSRSEETFKMMSKNINNILFLLVFSIAFALKLFFGKKYNLAEYTSIGFFITGFYTLIKIITMFIGKFTSVEVDNIELVVLILLISYSSFSLFQGKDFWSVLKYLLVGLFGLVFYFLLAIGFFFITVSLK